VGGANIGHCNAVWPLSQKVVSYFTSVETRLMGWDVYLRLYFKNKI